MPPPLMRDLMRGDKKRKINCVRFCRVNTGDKTDGFRERNGIGERFGEDLVTRELNDPELVKLERTEILRAIIQSGLHALAHALQIIGMLRIIVDFKIYV